MASIAISASLQQACSSNHVTKKLKPVPRLDSAGSFVASGAADQDFRASASGVAVVIAFGFLVLPSAKFLLSQSIGILAAAKEEVAEAPMVYGSVGLSLCSAAMAAWGVLACASRKYGNPACRGLRRAAEFDIHLETEDCVRSSGGGGGGGGGLKRGLFELRRDHHRELEAELKKMDRASTTVAATDAAVERTAFAIARLPVSGEADAIGARVREEEEKKKYL